jgi:lysyl-tRNA synthetase class 1
MTVPQIWPYQQAERVQDRIMNLGKTQAVFETGYGPSGLPHLGTFGEVARTTWVRRAFEKLTHMPTQLIAFSDDMDALRKVPTNVPEPEMLNAHVGRSLSEIPDPWHTHASYADHNNHKLMQFLDGYGFDYEFLSSTKCYTAGKFDQGLMRMAECHEEICDVVKRTLQKERRDTYSPFLPIHPVTREVMQVRIQDINLADGMLTWQDPADHVWYHTAIRGGACKAQWKADWALRWYVLGVDFEMSGKDLMDSVTLSSKICQVLGAEPPVSMTYELFLDEAGRKISKSVGNGVTMEEWLRYAPASSLCQFLFPNPQRARRIQVSQIPQVVDEYLANVSQYVTAPDPVNPVHHIHEAHAVPVLPDVSYSMLLNLVSVLNTQDVHMVLTFLNRYLHVDITQDGEMFRELVQCVINYFVDHVLPHREFVTPDCRERMAIQELRGCLTMLDADVTAEQIQYHVFEIGKAHKFEPLRDWFALLYKVLLGQSQGPRFGGFVHLYGVQNTIDLIDEKLNLGSEP